MDWNNTFLVAYKPHNGIPYCMEARIYHAALHHPRTLGIMETVPHIFTEAPAATLLSAHATSVQLDLQPMQEAHIGQAVSLICRSMNPEEGGYAAQTLHLHFSSRKSGIDDGRFLFVLTRDAKVAGVAGLHHYAWGPPENVWLSWFALDPQLHGQGFAGQMLKAVASEAQKHNFMKFYIETYTTPEFVRARAFYRAQGFMEVGGIPGWLPDGGDMLVLYKDLT